MKDEKLDIKYEICKREQYLEAWYIMFRNCKHLFRKDWRMQKVSPGRFQPLQTEKDNYCIVAYLDEMPIGLFGCIETKTGRILGKQIVVDPRFQKKGVGTELITRMEKFLDENCEAKNYTIVCLDGTAAIYEKRGLKPFKGPLKEYEGVKYESHFLVPLK